MRAHPTAEPLPERAAPPRKALVALLSAAAFATGCSERPATDHRATPAPPAASAPAPLPAPPWYEGGYRAALELHTRAAPAALDAAERAKERASARAGKAGTSEKSEPTAEPAPLRAALVLALDAGGEARGSLTGPLGEKGGARQVEVRGSLDGETLRLTLSERVAPAPDAEGLTAAARALAGVLVATRSEAGFNGALQLAQGDAARVLYADAALVRESSGPGDSARRASQSQP